MTGDPHVIILGGGPAGVGAAFKLACQKRAHVTVIEQRSTVGGNAGSFDVDGLRVDYGSHRLHPACDAEVLADLKNVLGDDLLDRPRHGRIRLRGRWIHFPLKPLDLLLRLPYGFGLGVGVDALGKLLPAVQPTRETFATVLERGLGKTICRDFYFPYARKIWGLDPDLLSATQARRRVSASSLGKMLGKIAASVPGLKPSGAGRFYYPRQGYGQISERLRDAATEAGAQFQMESRVVSIDHDQGRAHAVQYEYRDQIERIEAPHIWSTLPLTVMVRCMQPPPPAEVIEAASSMAYRAMILIYLVLEQDQFTEFDAHYFPDEAIPITRLSEPKNYSAGSRPSGVTVLCAELPCERESKYAYMDDDALGALLCQALESVDLPIQSTVRRVITRRLEQAYPLYQIGYEQHFDKIDRWLNGIEGVLTYGRQPLFAHDNTHHALFMAYAAVDCLSGNGQFDDEKWSSYREIFARHVVED